MNHSEMIAKISDQSRLKKRDVETVLERFAENTCEELAADNVVRVLGLGTFKLGYRAASKGRNPRTGEEMDVPAMFKPKFSPAKSAVEAMNTPMAEARRKRQTAA